jgi:hypothetical protein
MAKKKSKKEKVEETPVADERLSFLINSDLKKDLKVYCAENGTNITTVVNDLIKDFLEQE